MIDIEFLEKLLCVPSPTGFTDEANAYLEEKFEALGMPPTYSNKGGLKFKFVENPKYALAAHVDTLGAIISGVKADGTLRFDKIGGLSLNSAEGEYVTVHTLDGRKYRGTILLDNPAAHANATLSKAERSISNMHIRIDELVRDARDINALGIKVGDFVSLDVRFEHNTSSGYIKSRYLDNKAGCHVLYEVARQVIDRGITPSLELIFSNYEETGHGGAGGYSASVEELLVVDMGVVGGATSGEETACSICAKDSSGPYDYKMRKRLVQLAEKLGIPYQLDVYPYYSSDGSAAWRAGNQFRVALIGPGVAASHGNERTHVKGIEATVDLCMAYLIQ